MSTIGEALRKVQNQRQPVPPPVPPPGASRARPSRAPVYLAIVIGLLALIAVAALYYVRIGDKRDAPGVRAVVTAPPLLPLAPPPRAEPASPPEVAPGLPPPALTAEAPSVASAPAGNATNAAAATPAPPSSPAPAPARRDLPTLGGIFYSQNKPVAMINGSACMEGESVGEFQVVKIGVYSVTLKHPQGEYEIRLK